jgi:hypothetical protein
VGAGRVQVENVRRIPSQKFPHPPDGGGIRVAAHRKGFGGDAGRARPFMQGTFWITGHGRWNTAIPEFTREQQNLSLAAAPLPFRVDVKDAHAQPAERSSSAGSGRNSAT